MYSHFKPPAKIIKPQSLVEAIFEGQGFEKRRKKDISYYHLKMRDNVTRASYELQIPFEEVYLNRVEPYYKIQEVFVYHRSQINKDRKIPQAIVNAAKEKAHEVFSYLESRSRAVPTMKK